MDLSNRNVVPVTGDWLRTDPYQTVPEDLYHYVEHLKRVWPERQRFAVKHASPFGEAESKGYLDYIDDKLRREMYEGAHKHHHTILSSQRPVWVEDPNNGPLVRIRIVQGTSVPAPSGVNFL